MSTSSKRLVGNLARDLFVMEDENNPRTTQVDTIWPTTVLDQVYDNLSPTNKTLRQILEELKVEIITGGRGNIVFPVTTVNGQTGDVVLSKTNIGLGRVDNTADIDKPLSIPQRTAVEEMLATFDFHINLDALYEHINDKNNPHGVTTDQLDTNEDLAKLIKMYISMHNVSLDKMTHIDIRNSLSRLWVLVDGIYDGVEAKVDRVLSILDEHMESANAHLEIMNKKEDVDNKVSEFSSESMGDNTHYPSTKGVISYMATELEKFRASLPDVKNWIDDIVIIPTRDELPAASKKFLRKAYIIRKGISSFQEIAICRLYPDERYDWDISTMGTYSKFDPDYFVDTGKGLCINMTTVIEAILSENGMLDEALDKVLERYYKKEEIDKKGFITSIHIIPGKLDASIRFYINEDYDTMSNDIVLPGFHDLAYRDFVTEHEIADQAVWGRHIISKTIETRHLNERIVNPEHLTCRYGYLLGNTANSGNTDAHETSLVELADFLRPLIGGWPDPNVPGGNPWHDQLEAVLLHPHTMPVGVPHEFPDGSIAVRYVGKINTVANIDMNTPLDPEITADKFRLLDAGGSWMYKSDPDEWAVLGSSNITGHTYSSVYTSTNGLYLSSLSNYDRREAVYDIWVRYCKVENVHYFDGTGN